MLLEEWLNNSTFESLGHSARSQTLVDNGSDGWQKYIQMLQDDFGGNGVDLQ